VVCEGVPPSPPCAAVRLRETHVHLNTEL